MTDTQTPTHIFYVHAVCLQLDRARDYGPFPGFPTITYEFLRENEFGEHLFIYSDGTPEDIPCDIDPVTCNEQRHPDHWHTADEGIAVNFGWRRCGNTRRSDTAWGQFGVPMDSDFWSDLSFDVRRNTGLLRFTSDFNSIPAEAPIQETPSTHQNWE